MTGYRRDIDGLRAVAVLAVIGAHAGVPGLAGGYVGVDIFFVISGYLITRILLEEQLRGSLSIAGFYVRRARRILPALLAMLALCLAAGWWLIAPPLYERMGSSGAAAALFVSNIWFARRSGGYFDTASEYDAFLHTWSLAVEEQFYIVWPLLLVVAFRFGRGRLAPLLVALTLGSLVHSAWLVDTDAKYSFFLASSRGWELGVGALLAAVALPGPRRPWQGEAAALLAVATLAACIALYSAATPFPGWAALPPVLATAVLIWVHGYGSTAVGRVLSAGLPVGIGVISYSLYLWHWPLLVLARIDAGSLAAGPVRTVFAMAAAFAFAWLSWRFIEQPFRRRQDDRAAGRPVLLAVSAASLAGLALAGVAIARADGVWSRSPDLRTRYERAVTRSPQELACWAQSPAQRCRLGRASGVPTSVLLWGDSHAAAMTPGFQLWLERRGTSGEAAVLQACAPLLGVVRVGSRMEDRCADFNRDTLAHAMASASIDTVYLAARWPLLVSGQRPAGEAGGPIALRAIPGDSVARGNAALVEAGLDGIVAQLIGAGKHVVILTGVPEMGTDPVQAMLASRYLGPRQDQAPSLAEVRVREAPANAVLRRIATRHGAELIDFAGAICQPRCPVREGSTLLYRDENHLSWFGAEMLVPSLLEKAAPFSDAR